MIVKFRDTIPQQYRGNTDPFINSALKGIRERKDAAGLKEQADYIKSKLPDTKLPADKPPQKTSKNLFCLRNNLI